MLPGLGVLSIVQGRRDLESYAIDTNAIGGCVEVLFVKKDDAGEVYGVTLNRAGSPVSCTCPGHQFGRKKGIVCKHAAAVRELIADGILDVKAASMAWVSWAAARAEANRPSKLEAMVAFSSSARTWARAGSSAARLSRSSSLRPE